MDSIIKSYDSIVVGGGIAGCLTSLKIDKNNKVLLLEKENEVLSKSSSTYSGCYKLHQGIHYIGDIETAKTCLKTSLEFIKEFPTMLIKEIYSKFFIMSNSLFSESEIRSSINELKNYYNELIIKDPNNKLLGNPYKDYIREMSKDEYKNYIEDSIIYFDESDKQYNIEVIAGFEFIERVLDYNMFKNYITNQIKESSNITLKTNTSVESINQMNNFNHYNINAYNSKYNNDQYFSGKSVVNCSFENIEYLDKEMNKIKFDPDQHIRLKCSIVIKVPESMKKMTSMLFSIGPYVSFSFLDRNRLLIMSEHLCNLTNYKTFNKKPNSIFEIEKKLNLNNSFGINLVKEILMEASKYFKEPIKSDILNAEVFEIRRGFVRVNEKNYSNKSIYSKNSGVHSRSTQIHQKNKNYISNCSTKMCYAVDDSNRVSKFINNYLKQLN